MSGVLILTIALILAGGSFQFGYHTGVINEPLDILGHFIANASTARGADFSNKTVSALKTLTVTMFPVGGLIGALTAGTLADTFGRRKSMLLLSVPILLSCLLMGLSKVANSYEMLIIGRFLVGLPSGGFTAIAPMYLSEISPIRMRGAVGTMNQLIIVFAILISEVLGLTQLLGNEVHWPFLLAFSAIPSFFTLLILPFCPDSPRFLYLSRHDEEGSRIALIRFRGTTEIEEEMQEMAQEKAMIGCVHKMSIIEAFRIPYVRTPLLIGIVMQMSQQLSGINAVINYSTDLFSTTANLSVNYSRFATLGIGVFNLIITFVSVFLMDRLGRKTLHLTGLSLMAVWGVVMTIALAVRHHFPTAEVGLVYTTVVCVFLFVGSFAIGPGAIPWFITAEMFTQSSRAAAMTVCVAVNWICQIIIAEVYPTLMEELKDYSFVPFTVFLVLFAIFTWRLVPETKGKTPEEIENTFRRSSTNYEPIEGSANLDTSFDTDNSNNNSRRSLLQI